MLRRSNLFLAAEEYLALRAGDSIKVIATYSRDKSFFPLRREQVKKAFFIYQREGIVCLKEASTLCYEASYPWLQWVWLVYFVVMVIPIMFLMDRIGIDFDSIFFFDAIRFLAIVCSLVYLISSFVTVVVLGEEQCFGYLLLWIFMIQTVGIIVGCITHYLVWRKKRDT
ncbi:MAG: hypothetical protein LBG52_03400 [Candidatus Peribacteria bacterium]|nr:hypothetical protein [Candidatus Peribacteria bacterium]